MTGGALAKEKATQNENQDVMIKVYLTETKEIIQVAVGRVYLWCRGSRDAGGLSQRSF